MNVEQYLLTKLAEEASEVAKMALKVQQFGMDEVVPGQPLTNRQRLHAELNDLNAAITMLNGDCDLGYVRDELAVSFKVSKVDKFMRYSIRLGKVQP